ncbi:MAG: hypothetical protein DMD65_08365 [Gemmatimonadetes bacterium]|nr:MAG: hypothetical protein DMD65_08365 [Gemmatimonadota bacterium]
MAAEPVDVLVIGGGITGAGIARDAALRGFRTALVDKGDFGGGTSSHSSRLIHGVSRTARLRARVRGEPRAARAVADRAPPGASAAVPVSRVPRRPRSRLEARRRHVALRSARGVPQCAAPPLARAQGRAAARARAAGTGPARCRPLLRRTDRRRPSGDRDGPERRAGGRARRELCRGHESRQTGRPGTRRHGA